MKVTLAHKLRVEWEKINLESQRALNYLDENSFSPVKSAHNILSKNVKESAKNILNLTKPHKR